MSPWETVGAARYFGGAIKLAVGLDTFVITAADAPAFVMEGADCDVWSNTNPPVAVGRAGWSAEGRMIVLSLPTACGVCYMSGGQVVNHYIAKDKRPCAVIAPPIPGAVEAEA